jgi:hypothetical protein
VSARRRGSPAAGPARARPNALATLHRQIGNRAVAETLQRAVGFEFEDARWHPWRRGWFGRVYPAARQRVLHRGTGFELQADDTPGPRLSNLEFVTTPFDESRTGLRALRTTMREIQGLIANSLDPFVGQAGPANANTDPPYRYDQARFVPPVAMGFTGSPELPRDRILLSGGRAGGYFKVQATAGIPLDKLANVMEYLGTNPRGETPAQTLERAPARTALYAAAPPRFLQVLGNARALAVDVLQAMGADMNYLLAHRTVFAAQPAALVGFVASVMATMKLLQLPLAGVVKYRVALMPRTSYAAMLASLAPQQRGAIAADPGRFAAHLVAVSNLNPLLSRTQGIDPDTGLTVNDPFIRPSAYDNPPPHAVFAGISIADWIAGMTMGRDYLTPADMDAELRRQGVGRRRRGEARELLESFGTIGGMHQVGARSLAVFEQRAITPQGRNDLTFAEVYRLVWNQLAFLRQVRRAAAGAAGTYPSRRAGSVP